MTAADGTALPEFRSWSVAAVRLLQGPSTPTPASAATPMQMAPRTPASFYAIRTAMASSITASVMTQTVTPGKTVVVQTFN